MSTIYPNVIGNIMKICSKCKIEKEESCFYKQKDRLTSSCKDCINTHKNKFYLDNKDKI